MQIGKALRLMVVIAGTLTLTMADLKGQVVIEAAATDNSVTLESWFTKPFDTSYKFVLFNLNNASYDYETAETEFMSYSIISYDLVKGTGPVLGTRFLKDKAVALGGWQYTLYTGKIFITTNATSELKANPDFELYMLAQYKKTLTRKIAAFLQAQISFNFNFDMHILSFQQLRLGIDWKSFQSGFALNQFQFGNKWTYDIQPGIFIRREFQ